MPLTKLKYMIHFLLIVIETIVSSLFQWNSKKLVITVSRSQKQKGTVDCGLFAIANATAISFGKNPSKLQFKQEAMRSYLISCFNQKQMALFPCTGK